MTSDLTQLNVKECGMMQKQYLYNILSEVFFVLVLLYFVSLCNILPHLIIYLNIFSVALWFRLSVMQLHSGLNHLITFSGSVVAYSFPIVFVLFGVLHFMFHLSPQGSYLQRISAQIL